jgi:hypothetical protein
MSMKTKEGLATWHGLALTARGLSSGGTIGECHMTLQNQNSILFHSVLASVNTPSSVLIPKANGTPLELFQRREKSHLLGTPKTFTLRAIHLHLSHLHNGPGNAQMRSTTHF